MIRSLGFWLLLVAAPSSTAFQTLTHKSQKTYRFFAATVDGSSVSKSRNQDDDGAKNMYESILDDGNGHIRSDLATSLWNWDHNHHNKKFQFSTRKGLRLVDEIARELLESLSTTSFSSTSSSSDTIAEDSSAMSYADLAQEGVVALMHAMATFHKQPQHNQEKDFEKYASRTIHNVMSRCLVENSRPIRLPSRVHLALKHAQKERVRLGQELGREPTLAEVATEVGLTADQLEFYQLVSRGTVSVESTVEVYDPLLDATATFTDESKWDSENKGDYEDELGEDDLYQDEGDDEMWVHQEQLSGPLRDVIKDEGPSPDDLVLQSMIQNDMKDFLTKSLDQKELQLIRLRFGLTDENDGTPGRPATLQYIANQMDLSKQRVAQIEQRALDKLRTSYLNRYVETYLDDEHETIEDTV